MECVSDIISPTMRHGVRWLSTGGGVWGGGVDDESVSDVISWTMGFGGQWKRRRGVEEEEG